METTEIATESESSPKAYGTRGQNRGEEVSVDVRLKTGESWAFGYSYMMALHFQVDTGDVEVVFAGYKVTLNGRNLRPLYDLLQRRHVIWVQEAGTHEADFAREGETVVREIKVEEV